MIRLSRQNLVYMLILLLLFHHLSLTYSSLLLYRSGDYLPYPAQLAVPGQSTEFAAFNANLSRTYRSNSLPDPSVYNASLPYLEVQTFSSKSLTQFANFSNYLFHAELHNFIFPRILSNKTATHLFIFLRTAIYDEDGKLINEPMIAQAYPGEHGYRLYNHSQVDYHLTWNPEKPATHLLHYSKEIGTYAKYMVFRHIELFLSWDTTATPSILADNSVDMIISRSYAIANDWQLSAQYDAGAIIPFVTEYQNNGSFVLNQLNPDDFHSLDFRSVVAHAPAQLPVSFLTNYQVIFKDPIQNPLAIRNHAIYSLVLIGVLVLLHRYLFKPHEGYSPTIT